MVLILLISQVSGLEIREIELNPNDDCRDCSEWLKLYSDKESNLERYSIKDGQENIMNLSGKIEQFKIIRPSFSLNNDEERLYLYYDNKLIQKTKIISDPYNDNRTWKLTNNEWEFNSYEREEDIIILNKGKDIKKEEATIYQSKAQIIREYYLEAFIVFCVLAILSLLVKKYKNGRKNNSIFDI